MPRNKEEPQGLHYTETKASGLGSTVVGVSLEHVYIKLVSFIRISQSTESCNECEYTGKHILNNLNYIITQLRVFIISTEDETW